MEVSNVVKCGACRETELEEPVGVPEENRKPSPCCNSKSRLYTAEGSAEVKIYSELRAKARHPGPGKPFMELRTGDSFTHKTGVWNRLERVIDRAKDWYKEVVTDRKTGEEIHRCEEPLSKHQGRGSAKEKP